MVQIFAVSILPLRAEECFERYYAKSCEERRRKADLLKKQDDKARCIAAGLLLEYAYNMYRNKGKEGLAVANPLPHIETAENGKPYFADGIKNGQSGAGMSQERQPYFNLSHSGDYVLCAIGDAELGADIQKATRVRENVVKQCFSIQEQKAISALTGTDREVLFAAVWAQKEAKTKLSGRGIGEVLQKSRETLTGAFAEDLQGNDINVHHGCIGNDHAWAVAFYDKTQTVSLSVLPEGVFFK